MACFEATVVKKPQLAVVLPVKRPFPTARHADKPEYEQSGGKEQRVTRVGLHPLEKQFSVSVYGIGYFSQTAHVSCRLSHQGRYYCLVDCRLNMQN